jgi:hypothetical protein
MSTIVLIDNATTTATGTPQNVQALRIPTDNKTFQASGTTTAGSGAVSVAVEVSNDNANWITMGTIGLTLGTTSATDGFVGIANWTYVRGRVASISGTGATVSLFMGL